MRVCVVGLGKLGLPLAALAAASGHEVRGFDANPSHIETLRSGRLPIEEPGLPELMELAGARLQFMDRLEDAVSDWAELTCVIVPTPSLSNGYFDNSFVIEAVTQVGASLSAKQTHVVNIVSTVMPGSCEGVIRDALEKASQRGVGSDLGLCYNPEFIALGTVISDMRSPDMHLIGQSADWAGDLVGRLLASMTLDSVPQQRLTLWEAELVKLAVNNYVTMKVSFANLIAMLVDQGPEGADVDHVTAAIGMDTRIGSRYLKGGAPYGGPCFPRDTRALEALAASFGLPSSLSAATEAANQQLVDYLAEICIGEDGNGETATICLVGATYKAESGVLDDSPSVALAQRLTARGAHVSVWDPRRGLLIDGEFSPQVEAPVARTYVIMVPDATVTDRLRDVQYGARIVDVWRQLTPSQEYAEIRFFGRGGHE